MCEITEAYKAGREAYRGREPLRTNPYRRRDSGPCDASDWIAGWHAQERAEMFRKPKDIDDE